MFFASLDLSFSEGGSERLSTVFEESDCEFGPLAALVWFAGHFPRLLRSRDFFSAYWTFGHKIPFSNIT